MEELEFNIHKGVRTFWFYGPAINIDKDYLEKLCGAIIKKKISIKWSASLIPSLLDKSMYDLLYASGCIHLKIGVETLNEKILALFGRRVTSGSIYNALKYSVEAKIKNTVSFMVGLPYETELDNFKKMLFLQNNIESINSVRAWVFQLRRGAPIFQASEAFGIKLRDSMNNDMRYVDYDEVNGLHWDKLAIRNKTWLTQIEKFAKKNKIPIMDPEIYFMELATHSKSDRN